MQAAAGQAGGGHRGAGSTFQLLRSSNSCSAAFCASLGPSLLGSVSEAAEKTSLDWGPSLRLIAWTRLSEDCSSQRVSEPCNTML